MRTEAGKLNSIKVTFGKHMHHRQPTLFIHFASKVTAFFPESVNYNEKTSKQMLEIAGRMQANLHGTKVSDSVLSIFGRPQKGADS
jgi:hypothetical protein